MTRIAAPVVALHGAGMTPAAFGGLAEFLPLSAPALNASSIDDMAAGLEIQEPCLLLGHSMGALVALEAARHPNVRALALLGAAAEMPVHPDLLKTARENPPAAAALVLKWGVAAEGAKPAAAKIMEEGAQSLFAGLAACDAYKNGAAAARALDKPVLVIAGGRDKMVKPDKSKDLAALFPQGRFALLENAGHMMMIEQPEGTAALLSAFWR